MDIDDGWGDLSPSLEGIDLVGSFDTEDLSENPLSSLDAAAETLEENGSLKESALTKEYNNQGDLPEVNDQILLPPSEKLAENQDKKELKLLDKLGVTPTGDKVRDFVGFEAYEGYEVVMEPASLKAD